MTDHDEELPLSLPAAVIVEKFGEDIRAAIGFAVKDAARKSAVRWHVVSVIVAAVIAAGVAWAVLTYVQSKQSGIEFRVRYGDTTAVCARGPDASNGAPVVVCRPALN